MMHSRRRIIYLAGPMRGYPDLNYPEFHRIAAILRGKGHYVFNPAEWWDDDDLKNFPIRKAFRDYAEFITMKADTIVLLQGWSASKGAKAEKALAEVCGVDVFHLVIHPGEEDSYSMDQGG